MRCLLVGNYGVANVGDEALKDYFLQTYPDIDWIVVSASPMTAREVPRLPGGIRSFFSPWWKTVSAMRSCDAVVFGGGTLFADVESVYACFLWALHAFTARMLGKPVLLAFQGIGPFRSRLGEGIARLVCAQATFISVRDDGSAARVLAWHLNQNIVQTYDPVFSFMISRKCHISTTNVFTIIPRHNSDHFFIESAVQSYKTHGSGQIINIILMQPGSAEEQEVASRIRETVGTHVTVTPVLTVDELMEQISHASYVVTQRFHGALASLAAGIPTEIIPQQEGDKLSHLVGQSDADRQKALERTLSGEEAFRRALREIGGKDA